MDTAEKNRLLLTQLIFMFQSAAMQQMGKLKDPMLDKLNPNLEQAQISIDMIAMLQAKMKGNIGPDEERMFSSVLQDLRLNYVDEVTRKQNAAAEQPPVQEKPAAS
jgi:hypothetical protein